MAWNQPGGQKQPWGRRPGPDAGLDKLVRDLQRRFEALLRPRRAGGSGGDDGDGERSAGDGGNTAFVIILLAAVAFWLLSGFYQIAAAERGVIQRFGKYVETKPPGLGWHLPWPIETVSKVNVSNVNSVEYKSRVLTADVNLVDLRLGVQYQLVDPRKVLFVVRDPESSLREVSESAIREVIGRSELEGVLVSNRQAVTERTKELIQGQLDFLNAGIRVTSVNLTDVQVPEPVVPSQRDANKAIADRDRAIKEAEAYQSGIIPVAEGAASRQLEDAEAYRAQAVAIAEGEASRFEQLTAAYNAAPNVTRERLYLETVESVLKSSRKVLLDAKGGSGGNLIYLPLDKLIERSDRDADAARSAPPPEPDTVTVDGRSRGER